MNARILLTTALITTLTTPAKTQVKFEINYVFDSGGLFSGANQSNRAYLESAADYLENFLFRSELSAITPSPGNLWEAYFYNPGNGSVANYSNLLVPANRIVVFAGSRSLSAANLGLGGAGNYKIFSANSTTFDEAIQYRGADHTNTPLPWGGSVAFNNATNWYFDEDTETTEDFPGAFDFFTVAIHELIHLIGFGTYSNWSENLDASGHTYVGEESQEQYGSPVPLDLANAHWASFVTGTSLDSFEVETPLMNPTISQNERRYLTQLDLAAIHDLGYSAVPEPSLLTNYFGIVAVTITLLRRPPRRSNSV